MGTYAVKREIRKWASTEAIVKQNNVLHSNPLIWQHYCPLERMYDKLSSEIWQLENQLAKLRFTFYATVEEKTKRINEIETEIAKKQSYKIDIDNELTRRDTIYKSFSFAERERANKGKYYKRIKV